jgi:MFS family permease
MIAPQRTAETGASIQMSTMEEAPYPARAVAWYATLVLAFMYWLSILDRFIISLLVGPIKHDLHITDTQFGLLHGLAFAITFCLFGLVAGALADRFARRWVIFAGVSIWSVATAVCGLTQTYWQLLMARVGVGVGEAALQPSATSMLTDLFPAERLTSAMAVYSIGSIAGSGCAFLIGGVIVDLVSKTETIPLPFLGDVHAWKAVFLIIGVPGAFASLLIFTLPEPLRRGLMRGRQPMTGWGSTYLALIRFIRSQPRFFACHYTAFAFATAILTGAGVWYPAHMSRTFGWSSSKIGICLGVMLAVSGLASQLICGRFVDSMYRRGYRDAQFRWFAGCLSAATPLAIIATTSNNPWIFLCFQGGFLLLISCLGACAAASLNLVTPSSLRGSGIAFYAATSGLVGAAGGPVLIALVSDRIFHSESAIGLSIAVVTAACCPTAAILLWLGCRPMREAMTAQA